MTVVYYLKEETDMYKFKKKFLSKNDVTLLKRTFNYVKPYKMRFFIFLMFTIIIILLGIVQPLIWGSIVQCLAYKDYKSIFNKLIYLLVVFLAQSFSQFVKNYNQTILSNDLSYDLKVDMYSKMLNLPMKVFDKNNVGEFISRLQGDIFTLSSIITNDLVNVIIDILKIVVLGVVIFKINIKLSLVVLVVFPFSYICFVRFGKKLRNINGEIKILNDRYFSILQQALVGIKHIKAYGLKEKSCINYKDISKKIKDKEIKISITGNLSFVISSIINYLDDLIVIALGIYFISKNTLSIQYFIAFASYSGQFSQSLISVTKINSNIQEALVSLERIFGLIDNIDFPKEKFGDKCIENIYRDIEFQSVEFSYENNKKILKNINFNVQKNQLTAIVGRNGSGKSTIFNLLLNFYKPNHGEILIDGIDIRDLTEESIRKNISIVQQQPFLFNLSIKENMKLANLKSTEEEIKQVCKQVFMHEYIMGLDEKYDTVINEEASNLSGGQKQRLALAMCMLRKTPIILLDEATAAMDTEAEYLISEAINNISKDRTVIVITHNLSMIRNADKIIVLDEGKIVGQGSHEYLIKNNLVYKDLYSHEFDLLREDMELKVLAETSAGVSKDDK